MTIELTGKEKEMLAALLKSEYKRHTENVYAGKDSDGHDKARMIATIARKLGVSC